MNKEQFETKLSEIYGGTVTPLTAYVNPHAVMVCKCNKCGVSFFSKAGHMLGKQHQQHLCNMPYGDKNGERLEHVSARHKAKGKKKDQQALLNKVNEMIWEDYSYQQIAQELKVNPNILKHYFKSEGLIE
ncbi:adenylate kinase [Lysinibacillus yapensis]|uniref:Adenylate kinase n=1 Tax=Ureibacillus yapensis TaxID=2304605 RepID=A0A396SM55_9BACL|nr:adenylate kinase [Lysinibacillus yapensis]RHW36676.1 adenylate kinase [Lysinibacillus yapensis]